MKQRQLEAERQDLMQLRERDTAEYRRLEAPRKDTIDRVIKLAALRTVLRIISALPKPIESMHSPTSVAPSIHGVLHDYLGLCSALTKAPISTPLAAAPYVSALTSAQQLVLYLSSLIAVGGSFASPADSIENLVPLSPVLDWTRCLKSITQHPHGKRVIEVTLRVVQQQLATAQQAVNEVISLMHQLREDEARLKRDKEHLSAGAAASGTTASPAITAAATMTPAAAVPAASAWGKPRPAPAVPAGTAHASSTAPPSAPASSSASTAGAGSENRMSFAQILQHQEKIKEREARLQQQLARLPAVYADLTALRVDVLAACDQKSPDQPEAAVPSSSDRSSITVVANELQQLLDAVGSVFVSIESANRAIKASWAASLAAAESASLPAVDASPSAQRPPPVVFDDSALASLQVFVVHRLDFIQKLLRWSLNSPGASAAAATAALLHSNVASQQVPSSVVAANPPSMEPFVTFMSHALVTPFVEHIILHAAEGEMARIARAPVMAVTGVAAGATSSTAVTAVDSAQQSRVVSSDSMVRQRLVLHQHQNQIVQVLLQGSSASTGLESSSATAAVAGPASTPAALSTLPALKRVERALDKAVSQLQMLMPRIEIWPDEKDTAVDAASADSAALSAASTGTSGQGVVTPTQTKPAAAGKSVTRDALTVLEEFTSALAAWMDSLNAFKRAQRVVVDMHAHARLQSVIWQFDRMTARVTKAAEQCTQGNTSLLSLQPPAERASLADLTVSVAELKRLVDELDRFDATRVRQFEDHLIELLAGNTPKPVTAHRAPPGFAPPTVTGTGDPSSMIEWVRAALHRRRAQYLDQRLRWQAVSDAAEAVLRLEADSIGNSSRNASGLSNPASSLATVQHCAAEELQATTALDQATGVLTVIKRHLLLQERYVQRLEQASAGAKLSELAVLGFGERVAAERKVRLQAIKVDLARELPAARQHITSHAAVLKAVRLPLSVLCKAQIFASLSPSSVDPGTQSSHIPLHKRAQTLRSAIDHLLSAYHIIVTAPSAKSWQLVMNHIRQVRSLMQSPATSLNSASLGITPPSGHAREELFGAGQVVSQSMQSMLHLVQQLLPQVYPTTTVEAALASPLSIKESLCQVFRSIFSHDISELHLRINSDSSSHGHRDERSHLPYARNPVASSVIKRFCSKLDGVDPELSSRSSAGTGADGGASSASASEPMGSTVVLSVPDQVKRLIHEATAVRNLARLYEGTACMMTVLIIGLSLLIVLCIRVGRMDLAASFQACNSSSFVHYQLFLYARSV